MGEIEYKLIEKANSEINKIDIKGKMYSPVNERITAFKKVYPKGKIITDIIEKTDTTITMKATIYDNDEVIIASGHASEEKKGMINTLSMIENCETSAVGRALGFCGFGIDGGIASEQEMQKVEEFKLNNKKEEIYNKMFISETDAIKIVKVAIADLMRKQGIIKVELANVVQQELWTDLEELNLQQLKRLEGELARINNSTHKWHKLYNQNSKIKNVVPVNQQVVYKSSIYQYGTIALKQAGEDEITKSEIIDGYLDMGIDLTKVIE